MENKTVYLSPPLRTELSSNLTTCKEDRAPTCPHETHLHRIEQIAPWYVKTERTTSGVAGSFRTGPAQRHLRRRPPELPPGMLRLGCRSQKIQEVLNLSKHSGARCISGDNNGDARVASPRTLSHFIAMWRLAFEASEKKLAALFTASIYTSIMTLAVASGQRCQLDFTGC